MGGNVSSAGGSAPKIPLEYGHPLQELRTTLRGIAPLEHCSCVAHACSSLQHDFCHFMKFRMREAAVFSFLDRDTRSIISRPVDSSDYLAYSDQHPIVPSALQ